MTASWPAEKGVVGRAFTDTPAKMAVNVPETIDCGTVARARLFGELCRRRTSEQTSIVHYIPPLAIRAGRTTSVVRWVQ